MYVQSYGNGTFSHSLVYLNNPFESCNVSQVAIYMEHGGGRTAAQIAVASWGITVLGMSAFRVELDDGPVIFNMTGVGSIPCEHHHLHRLHHFPQSQQNIPRKLVLGRITTGKPWGLTAARVPTHIRFAGVPVSFGHAFLKISRRSLSAYWHCCSVGLALSVLSADTLPFS